MLTGLDISLFQWAALLSAGVLIGMSKTGIQGINTVSIPILAIAFGAKPSTGLILPMLCFADLIAVIYYRRSAQWKYIFKLLPTAIAGFFIAIAVDRFVPDDGFRRLMGVCILVALAVMLRPSGQDDKVVSKWWYGAAFGIAGGFTTMIGNAAGPVLAVYLLSVRLPKLSFVGTSAWFFLIVNYLKLPLQIFVWDNITVESLRTGLITAPFIILGAVLGIVMVDRFPESGYRRFIVIMTALSAIMLLI
ncbi:MAG: sulfite exporter TauE/SafE family protein [Alistipes sp.]|nr:sulfite exporter TauE/SafE family protein [Alistipes sp.]